MSVCDSEKERHLLWVTEVRASDPHLLCCASRSLLGVLLVLCSPRRHGHGGYIRIFNMVSKRKKIQASLREIRKALLECRGVFEARGKGAGHNF